MNIATFDTSRLPIVHIQYTGNKPTQESLQNYFDTFADLLNDEVYETNKIVLVFDLSQLGIFNMAGMLTLFKQQARFNNLYQQRLHRVCSEIAIVLRSCLLRSILRYFISHTPTHIPIRRYKTITSVPMLRAGQS
jgi:hypothetical protein